jgi:hypothetical protein
MAGPLGIRGPGFGRDHIGSLDVRASLPSRRPHVPPTKKWAYAHWRISPQLVYLLRQQSASPTMMSNARCQNCIVTVRGEGRKNGRGSHTIDLINAGTTDLKATLRSVSVNGYEYAFPTEANDPSYHRKLPRQSAFSKVRDSRSSLQRRPLGRPAVSSAS